MVDGRAKIGWPHKIRRVEVGYVNLVSVRGWAVASKFIHIHCKQANVYTIDFLKEHDDHWTVRKLMRSKG